MVSGKAGIFEILFQHQLQNEGTIFNQFLSDSCHWSIDQRDSLKMMPFYKLYYYTQKKIVENTSKNH